MTFFISHDHIGINVTPDHLEATIEWYSSTLGFAVDQRFDVHGTTFVFLVNQSIKIELIAGASAAQDSPPKEVFDRLHQERLQHFCLAVDDLDAALRELADRDVQLIGGPMDVSRIGRRIGFITDNVGTVIELSQVAAAV